MRILLINVVCGIRSTGRICTDLAVALEKQGHEVRIAYGRDDVPQQFQKYAVRIGSDIDVKLHGVKARLMDGCGFGSRKATEKFVEWIKEYDPDIIHLHNLHGYYINVRILFEYLKSSGKRIVWTLHDCWAFTGHCTYFEYANCNRWLTGCENCPQKKQYPMCVGIDGAKRNYQLKKEIFLGVKNLKVVVPSVWLSELVKKSFLKEYEIWVINNGVDISVFHPTKNKIKTQLGIEDKRVVLGVAAIWDSRKGLEMFFDLAKIISDRYHIVLVGLDKKQMQNLPPNITGIGRTNSAAELASYYSMADWYFNPTFEDNFPTTNLESIACGTPVLSFRTGGSAESAKRFGAVFEKGDVVSVCKYIENTPVLKREESLLLYDTSHFIDQYLNIYSKCGET